MKAAEALFLEKGFRGTTIKMIVKKAKTSVGNCYFYFKNKEDILIELTHSIFEQNVSVMDYFCFNELATMEKVALLSYSSSYKMLLDENGTLIAILGSGLKEIRKYQMKMFQQSVENYFTPEEIELFKGRKTAGCPQLAYVFKATHGSMSNIAESYIKGELKGSKEELAFFMTRWQMQAMGFDKDQVENAIEYLKGRLDEIHTYLVSTLEQS